MSPSNWGPPTWDFIHTICAKIKPESFSVIGPSLISYLMKISTNLPCPECSNHSRLFWNNVSISNIKTNLDLINLMFVFHQKVNKRNNKLPYKYENLQIYESKNLINTYNNFMRNFNTKGNMKLMTDSFQRNLMMTSLKRWLMSNINHFII
uniref:thiol oxidase n=1 Tax=viral metagenome TaxID=1070528 RepID=A0A6C0KP12_9ZZZZ